MWLSRELPKLIYIRDSWFYKKWTTLFALQSLTEVAMKTIDGITYITS